MRIMVSRLERLIAGEAREQLGHVVDEAAGAVFLAYVSVDVAYQNVASAER
ncbi:hypothetical protein AB0B13_00425 [Streptomyces sp. NPDC042898]|uniref:hypothetical protein n=1 Tax=unclassified Streptomyces TaxID=2593676 RepID=UPI003320CB8D